MISRKQAFILAIALLAVNVISLSFDLHGAIPVVVTVGFSILISAAVGRSMKTLRVFKRIVGALFVAVFGLAFVKGSPESNQVFNATFLFGGLVCLFDSTVLGVVRNRQDDSQVGSAAE